MSEQKLNTFSIIEILQYVRKNAQTGRLLFDEKGQTLAELYFNKGHLVHARNDKIAGDDVVYQLLSNRTAKINWERNLVPKEENVSKTDEVLLLGALGILTEDDAANVMDVVSQEAEYAMDNAFEQPPVQTPPEPVIPDPAPRQSTVPLKSPATKEPVNARPSQSTLPLNIPAPLDIPAPLADTVPPLPSVQPTQSDPVMAVPVPLTDPPTSPALGTGAETLEGLGRLQSMLGDEVLRPPRFRGWTGLPLPFVSAYAFDPADRQVKSAYDLLWKEKFSGVLTCVFGQIESLTILYKGRAVHSRYVEGRNNYKDQNAMRRTIELTLPAGQKNAVLIYPLEAEFVHSYAALIMGQPELTGLSSQSVKINKLLNTLEQAQRTGVVHVSNNDENGYIFLSQGHKLGSYYEVEDVLEESILRVYQIVGKSGSIIDVLTSPIEEKLFEYASRPKSAGEVKQQIIEIAQDVFGKRAGRVVQLLAQSEDNTPALKTYCNQARRVGQMFIDKTLADQFYERAMFLLQELG